VMGGWWWKKFMSGVHSVPLVRAGFDLACECSAQPRIEDGHTVAHKGGSRQNERERLGSLIYVCCKEVNEICGSIYELGVV
jgi:hypothetical protein